MLTLYDLLESGLLSIDDSRSEADRALLSEQLELENRLKEIEFSSGAKIVLQIENSADFAGYKEAHFYHQSPDGKRIKAEKLPGFLVARNKQDLDIEKAIERASRYITCQLTKQTAEVKQQMTYSISKIKITNFTADSKDQDKNRTYGLADVEIEMTKQKMPNQDCLQKFWNYSVQTFLSRKTSPGKRALPVVLFQESAGDTELARNAGTIIDLLAKAYQKGSKFEREWYHAKQSITEVEDARLKEATNIGICSLFERIFFDNREQIEENYGKEGAIMLKLPGMLVAYKEYHVNL